MNQVITEKVISARVDKTDLVKKLLSEGHIDFDQAILLLEKEVQYQNSGTITTSDWNPLNITYTGVTLSDEGNVVITANK